MSSPPAPPMTPWPVSSPQHSGLVTLYSKAMPTHNSLLQAVYVYELCTVVQEVLDCFILIEFEVVRIVLKI